MYRKNHFKFAWPNFALSIIVLASIIFKVYVGDPAKEAQIMVSDSAKDSLYLAGVNPTENAIRDMALRTGLRIAFRWGVYSGQTDKTLFEIEKAFWPYLRLDVETQELKGGDFMVDFIVFGANYAKVYLKNSARLLQVNFWDIERIKPDRVNPFGFRFRARISLIERKGLSL